MEPAWYCSFARYGKVRFCLTASRRWTATMRGQGLHGCQAMAGITLSGCGMSLGATCVASGLTRNQMA